MTLEETRYVEQEPTPTAWEDPSAHFPSNFGSSWWESLTSPNEFFARLRWDDPPGRPLLYFLLATILGAAFSLGWRLAGVGSAFTDALLESSAEMAGESGGLAAELLAVTADETAADVLLDFFIEPFVQLIVLAITVLIVHLFVLFLASERRNMAATLRVACYAAGPSVLTIFPFLGATVGWIWSIVLLVLGISAAHRASIGRASAIVLLPMLLTILALSAFFVVLILFAAAAMSVARG